MPSKGDNQPPINSRLIAVEIKIMLAYSDKKNNAKPIAEYSTWNPATISDSPSAISNGARFVSAIPEIQNTKNKGNNGIM